VREYTTNIGRNRIDAIEGGSFPEAWLPLFTSNLFHNRKSRNKSYDVPKGKESCK